VATDVGGLRGETAGQRDVTLVPPDNVEALVEALRPLLHDLEQADALGAEARARAERELSPAAGARRLAAVWSSLPA
jgi:glycosyltransferase involved in cell wall biosynthesis